MTEVYSPSEVSQAREYTKRQPLFFTPRLVRQAKLNFPASFAERKNTFLHHLASPAGRLQYKRYTGSPIRYAGGKSLAVGLIIEHIPDNATRIISPFLGGGSVEVACAVELELPVIASDVFDALIQYWQIQLSQPQALYERLRQFAPTREEFRAVKECLKKHWTGEEPLGQFELAAYFYFNHNTSYGPHFLGWPSDVYLQSKRYPKMIEKVRDFRAVNMEVDCASFEEVIPKYRDDFSIATRLTIWEATVRLSLVCILTGTFLFTIMDSSMNYCVTS